ncbi:MAG: hypothetical protein ACXADF_15020 [Candidatus Thorarchaeota archaeon]|jgi:hypothetical protein
MVSESDLLNVIDDLVIAADAVMDSLQFGALPPLCDQDNLGDAITNARSVVQEVTKEQEPCEAFIRHGPGHQSKTKCYLTGIHFVHEARYGSHDQLARWTSDETSSGFFDEPPEDPEDKCTHSWKRTGIVKSSIPPWIEVVCRRCGEIINMREEELITYEDGSAAYPSRGEFPKE